MTTQVCTIDGGGDPARGAVSNGGLIDPSRLPARAADLDTGQITGAADGVRAMGSSVDTQTDEIAARWTGGLPGCYTAPEQEMVFALMDSPAIASQDLLTTFNSMAGHLDTYAGALATIKPKLADFERRAQQFRDDVVNGVWVDAEEAKDAHLGTWIAARWNDAVGNEQERKLVPWYEDGETVERNNGFLDEIAGLYAQVSEAASSCATSINGLTSLPPDQKIVPPIPKGSFTNPESPMPWGSPREEDRNCPESVGHGAYQFGKGTVDGLGSLISYNPESGKWGDWGHAGQAWMGTGNLLLSLSVTSSPIAQALNGVLKASGNGDSDVSKWIDERNLMTATVASSIVGIDLQAKDIFHKWKQDGVATFTESFLNVGTMFIPGAGQVGAGLKAVGIGARVAKISAAVADFAVPAGSWLVKGGIHAFPVLKNVIRFGDDLPLAMMDDVVKGGARVPNLNPAALADDLAGGATKAPTPTPVSRHLFDDRAAAGDPPRTNPAPAANAAPTEAPRVDGPTGQQNAAQQPGSQPAQQPGAQPATTGPEAGPEQPHGADRPATNVQPEASTAARPESSTAHADSADSADNPAGDRTTEHPHESTAGGDPNRPAGFPQTHPSGTDYSFGTDGRAHLADDPSNTFRDRSGRLHEVNGSFATDPHAGGSDLPVEQARALESTDAQFTEAQQAAHDADVTARAASAEAAQAASGRLDRLIAHNQLDPAAFKGSKTNVLEVVDQLKTDGVIDRRTARSLTNAVNASNDAAQALRQASERMGDRAAALVSRLRGETTLIGSGGAGAGRFDHVTLGDPPPQLTVYEAKGGDARLGYRTVDGVRTQQGTGTYLTSIAQLDPRFTANLRSFMEHNPGSAITHALKDGSIKVNYDLVQALPNGRVKVTRFEIDVTARDLFGMGK